MSKEDLEQRIKETKELIKYSQKKMGCAAVKELKEDLAYYKTELKKIAEGSL